MQMQGRFHRANKPGEQIHKSVGKKKKKAISQMIGNVDTAQIEAGKRTKVKD